MTLSPTLMLMGIVAPLSALAPVFRAIFDCGGGWHRPDPSRTPSRFRKEDGRRVTGRRGCHRTVVGVDGEILPRFGRPQYSTRPRSRASIVFGLSEILQALRAHHVDGFEIRPQTRHRDQVGGIVRRSGEYRFVGRWNAREKRSRRASRPHVFLHSYRRISAPTRRRSILVRAIAGDEPSAKR